MEGPRPKKPKPNMPTYFGGGASFKARFVLSQCPKDTTHNRPSESEFCHHETILHDEVLQCLGPHEILALYRTSRITWKAHAPRSKHLVLLRSVFAYLRISEECAQTVLHSVRGGWKAFAPLLTRMCEEIAGAYGHFEPDVAHRCFLAEQACFSNCKGQGEDSDCEYDRGKLAGYEMGREFWKPRSTSEGVDNMELRAPPTLEELRGVGEMEWGDIRTLKNWYGDSVEESLGWMQKHAHTVQDNRHYKLRLEHGLYPVLPLYQSTESVSYEWMLTVGPNMEQNLVVTYGDSGGPKSEGFVGLNLKDDFLYYGLAWNGDGLTDDGSGGIVELLLGVGSPYVEAPTLSMAIWCMRHDLKPFDDKSIDWETLTKEVCDNTYKYYAEQGRGCYDGKAKVFLLNAITSSFYGPADVRKYED